MPKKVTYYDPPSGWMYGFPKRYQPEEGDELIDTLRRDGYPEEELQHWASAGYELGPPCRFWEKEE